MNNCLLSLVCLALMCPGCDYHINALDPQLQPPKTFHTGDSLEETSELAEDLRTDPGSKDIFGEMGERPAEVVDEVKEVAGCTDEAALNYDPEATSDDGSCLFNVTITFNLDMSCAADLVLPHVAGGDTFGMPGDHPMSDEDGDGIWTVQVTLPPALGTNYTYTSDACDNWSCKEQIGGQECAMPPYDDRYLNSGTEDHEVNECFGQCGDGPCGDCAGDES
jgi:hypothetical protein